MEIDYVVFFYFIGAILVGYFIYKEIQEPSYTFGVNKKLGPSYWGVYTGYRSEEETLRTIVPPPCSEGRAGDGTRKRPE